jgi:phosphoesterase RecJ-like protein
LAAYQHYFLIGHREPDGDCVGSQLALASFLRRQGKTVDLVSVGPFAKTEIAGYAGLFIKALPAVLPENTAAVVLDCSSFSRTGLDPAALPADYPLAYLDHHRGAAPEATAVCIDDKAPAVTCMVQALIETAGLVPTREEAEFLLFGLCTDTGFFRHLDSDSTAVFAMISRLVAVGASPKTAFYMMNGGKALASRQLMGLALQRLESYYDGRLLITWLDLDDQKRFGLEGRDSDMLYQLLMTIENMEAAVVIRQESESDCTVGFRSMKAIDVSAIAAGFGGGGHRLASGLHVKGVVSELKPLILAAFEPAFVVLDRQKSASLAADVVDPEVVTPKS